MKKPYQDIWRNGKLVTPGRRDCAGRYEAIKTALEAELGRGFTVADIGGWDGYFAVRLAEDLGCDAANVDRRDIKLPCHRKLDVTAATVADIGFHEALLCLSVLHHMEDWREVYAGLKGQCLLLAIEVCHPDETTGPLSPVMRQTAHRIAEQYEAVSADAVATIAETPCLDNPRIKRPTFLVRIGVKGRIEPGTGKAAELMAETQPEDWAALGYVPSPGTLNVAVPEIGHDWLKGLPGVKAPGLHRSTHYVPVLAGGEPAALAGGEPAHVHFARSPRNRPEKVIELVAERSFRDAGWQDGDDIFVVPQ